MEIDGVSILITFVETPKGDNDTRYIVRVYWDGDDFLGNWTKCQWGESSNSIHTHFENSTSGEILDEYVDDVIGAAGKIIVIPIYHTDLIANIMDPHIVAVDTQFRVAVGESYTDELDYATGTFPFPGFTSWITIGGISLIVMIGLLVKKKKS